MAEAASVSEEIFALISEEEKKSIPDVLTKRLEELWETKVKEITALKIDNEKQKITGDQEKFQLERELVAVRTQLEEETRLKDEAKTRSEELEQRLNQSDTEVQNAKARINALSREIQHSHSEQENASTQSAAMAGSLESRNKRIQELQEQVEKLEEQLTVVTRAKCEAVIRAEEAGSRELHLQYKEKRLEQERSLLTRQVDRLQQQLEQRVEESVNQRREHSTTILRLQTDLNHKLEELRVEREENERIQKGLEEKSQRIEELLSALNASRESEMKLDETYRQELVAQKKLADIYQGSCQDEKERCTELEKAVEELRKLLQEASEQYGCLERAKKAAEEESAEALQQSNLLVKELKEELDKVNLLMEASSKKDLGGLEDLSPAASAASQLVSRGLSLTQLYSEYMSVSEKLIGTEEENKRLKRYVDQILQEIEDRVPVFKKQRDDHQKSLETITSLHSQLEETLADLEKQRIESQEARRRAKYLERENSRLGMEVKDLGKQVTILVMQVEAARAGQPPPVIPVENDSPTGAGEVISQRLVAFRNVAELQEQNTHLRTSLRELSQQMEAVEKEAVENRTQDLQEELDAAKAQLSELQAARERQESLMENIVNQRNMYRTLLSQQSPQTKAPSTAQPSQSSDVSQEELKKVKEELENSKKELATLKKEHEEYREEKTKNDKLLQDEYENLRANMEKTRNENVKLISQAEYNDERIKTQQNNAEVLQRQIMALEKNNSTLQGIIGRHESTIETLRNELLTLQKKLSCAEVTLENLREERMLLKESEARLLSERESYERNQASQAMVLANLETIKINLERSDATEKMRYENQIQELTEQCSRLKAKLESNIEVKEAAMKLTDAENRIKSMHQEHAAMTKQLLEVKSELSATKTRLAEAQDKMRSAPSPQGNRARGSSPVASSPFRLAGSSPQIRDLQVQLTEERASVATLQASLDQSKRNIDELMGVTKQQEKQLAESNEACKIAQGQLSKLEKEKSEVEEKLAKTETQLSEAVEEAEAVKTLLQTQLAKMQDELQAAQKKLSDANEALTTAKGEEEKAKKEAQQKTQLAGEVQDKYEREVMLHGADLKALAALKEKQAEYNAELQQITMAKLKAEEAVRDTRLGFEERENLLRRENKDLLMRSHELEEQNKALLDQFTQLSDKMAALQTKLSVPGADNPNASFTEDEARSSDQLREVIKYLRRERDVAAGKCEVALAEVQRLTAQKKILESQIEQATKNLSEEREKSQASLDSAGRYGELLRKVHTMDALADSNRLLREEKEGMQNTITEFKAKYESLEKQIEPLQEKQRLSDNKIESLMLEKRSIENEKDLYKKRTQELVEKLNRAKPEDFIKLQQEVVEQQKTLQSKEAEVSRLKNQLAQLSKNQQMIVNQKNQFQQQLNIVRTELHKTTEEFKRLTMEKNRMQAQNGEEFKRVNIEKARLQQQLVATQERVRSLETSSQHAQTTHQQEMSKAQEQRNREQQQERQQIMDLKQREDAFKSQLDATRKEAESLSEKVKDAETKLADALKKADNFEKQALQLRKIATKYKKAAEGGSATAASTTGDGSEEPASGGTVVSAEKVKEYEETIASLRQKQDKAQEDANKLQQELTALKQTLSSKDSESNIIKTQSQQKDSELTKLRNELETKARELQVAQTIATSLKQNVTKQIADVTKRLDDKKQMYENRVSQLEKERDHLSREVEMVNKKLQIQQRQLENLQKQAAGTSKPSTSGVPSEKTGFEPPPTANIKPMNAPVAPSASPRSQTATQVVPPSRAIPTASIRPMAPPSGGSAPPQGSTVVVVSPLETHSDGMVSSTVTLPQATVTPTPAISAPTLLTTATTTPAATTMTSTLTATVSPTPASASLTTPVAPAVALPSTPSSQSTQPSASQSTLASQSSSVSQSSAIAESTPASQPTSSGPTVQMSKSSGHLQTAAAASSTGTDQSTLASQSSSGSQSGTASTSIVVPIVSAVPVSPAQHARQDTQDVSADALVKQAIALVSPLSSQEVAGPSSAGSAKRKLEPTEATTKEAKRACVEDDEAGPSSSHGGQENEEEQSVTPEDHDTVVVDSDGEEPDQEYMEGEDEDDDEDDDDDDDDDDDEAIEDEDQIDDDDEDIRVIEDNEDDMERDEESRGFSVGNNQEGREANEDMRSADAEAEAASESSAHVEESNSESPDAPSESQRPQPSGGSSQPSSSGQNEGPSQTSAGVPLGLPRPVRQERPVGRQNLAPFNQLPHYEEGGDDSIVPSTPTLFVPRRGDGFSEAVSSPQVPSGGFVFGSNAEVANPPQTSGLAQMAEGGLIDDTRIDLGLDEGNRSQPTTPLRRSPTAELGVEGGVSTSEGESTREPPTVLVTGGEQSSGETSRDCEDNFTEADSMAVDIGDDNEVEEEEEDEDDDVEEGEHDDVIDVEGDDDGNEEEESQGGETEEREGSSEMEQPSADVSSAPSSTPSSPSNPARRITPITWDNSPQRMRADRGRGFMGMPVGRGLLRGRGFPPSMRGAPLLRGPQRARRSRPGSFSRGGI